MSVVSLPWRDVDVVPDVGRFVRVDGWGGYCSSCVETCEIESFAPFRIPSLRYTGVSYACRIKVTGRKAKKLAFDDRHWVRIEIEWVKDGEPNTFSRGWMAV